MRHKRLHSRHLSLLICAARFVMPVCFLSIVPSMGCASHSDRRLEASQRWNHVRGRVKYQLALEQYERGQIDVALETVNEAIAVDPAPADQYLLLAQCFLEQGKYVSARSAAEEAHRCAPESAEVDYTLGVIAERTENLQDALKYYRLARSRSARVLDYVVAEAECLTAMGRSGEAIALVTANVGRFDSDGTLEMLLAQICLLTGDRETALHNLGLAMERSGCRQVRTSDRGGCDVLIEEYGRLLSDMGRHIEAVALLRPHVVATYDVPPSVVNALCASQLEIGRPNDAKRLLRREVDRRGDNPRSWVILARASMMVDDWTSARRCADQLERLVPRSAMAHLLRGFVCWKQEDHQAAIDSLQRATEIDSGDPLVHCLLGQVLEDSGEPYAVAEAHYEQALQVNPQYTWARSLLGLPQSRATHASQVFDGDEFSGIPDGAGTMPSVGHDIRGFELFLSAWTNWTRDRWNQAIHDVTEAERRGLNTTE